MSYRGEAQARRKIRNEKTRDVSIGEKSPLDPQTRDPPRPLSRNQWMGTVLARVNADGSSGRTAVSASTEIRDYGEVSGTVTIDQSFKSHRMTLSGNVTIAFDGTADAQHLTELVFVIVQKQSNKFTVAWPDSVVTQKSIKIKDSSESDIENHLVGFTVDGGITYQISNVGGRRINLGSIDLTRKLSELEIDIDLDMEGFSVQNVSHLNFQEANATPANPGSLFFSEPDLKYNSGSFVETLATLSDIAEKLDADLSNYPGTFPLDKIPDIPSYKITGLDALNSIEGLSEYTAAANGDSARLRVPLGMDIENLGKIKFNTILESSIGTYEGIKKLIVDEDDPQNYKTVIEQVMNFLTHGEKTMAISSLLNSNLTTREGNVMEFFGKKAPKIKIVDEHFYKLPSSAGSVPIGSIYFDALGAYTGRDDIEAIQTTFAEIKAIAETGQVDYPAWNPTKSYKRGDRVSYGGKSYLSIINLPNLDNTPSSNTGYWREFSTTSIDRGKLAFVLRDLNKATLGENDDVFSQILTLDIDSGVYIDSHITTKDDAFVNLNGHVNIGSAGNYINAFSDLHMYGNKIDGLPDPINDQDAATKKYVDENSRNVDLSEFIKNNTDFEFLPASDDDSDSRIGSSSKRWSRIYGAQNYLDEVYTDEITEKSSSGLRVGKSNTKLGFFGARPVSKPTINFGTNNTPTEINANFTRLRNFLEELGLADVI